MKLLQKATNDTVYLKMGIHGFQGSGKSYTAKEIAIGLAKTIGDGKPVAMIDTEKGSDALVSYFEDAGVGFDRAKTRAFKDLLTIIDEAEKDYAVLIIDSITHFWQDLTRSFKKARNITGKLQFQHWDPIKEDWGWYTTRYLNSKLHIIMCGRAGYEYEFEKDEEGRNELIKTGNKMKAEGETGFEPDVSLFMERIKKSVLTGNPNDPGIINRCTVFKDRWNRLNGKVIDSPKYEDFLPVIKCLNIGGKHIGYDDSRTSEEMYTVDGNELSAAQYRKQCEITLDLIKEIFVLNDLSGTASAAKKRRSELLKKHFDTPAWTEIETMRLERLQQCYENLRTEFSANETRKTYTPDDSEPPEDVELPTE